jgi:hypothetical protein
VGYPTELVGTYNFPLFIGAKWGIHFVTVYWIRYLLVYDFLYLFSQKSQTVLSKKQENNEKATSHKFTIVKAKVRKWLLDYEPVMLFIFGVSCSNKQSAKNDEYKMVMIRS